MEQKGLFGDIIPGEHIKDEDKPISHIAFILDKSGSMASMRKVAIDNFNEQIQTLKKESDGLNTFITLVSFNNIVKTEFFEKPLNDVEEINEYKTDGLTALYDAIGFTIKKFRKLEDISDPKINSSALFIIITDGYENHSKKYCGDEGRKKLKSIIEELEATNKWTFTFMGGDMDVIEVAKEGMSFSSNNISSYEVTGEGYKRMSEELKDGITNYYNLRKMGHTATKDFFKNTSDEKEIEYVQSN